MGTKLTLLASALLGLSMSAMAGQPITLNDSQMDSATAGDGFTSRTTINLNWNVDERIRHDKVGRFDVVTRVVGQSAVADATSDVFGLNGDAQTFTVTQIARGQTSSASKSIALGGCGCF
jgi:hypothetical protein